MLTGIAREELRKLLNLSVKEDLKMIELKIVPGTPQSNSKEERIEAILSNASQPSEVLRQQRLRKPVIRRYLWQCGIPVELEQPQSEYIKILLDMWQVKNDDYLWNFLTADEIDREINRFEEKMRESLQDLKLRIRARPSSLQEKLHMKKSMDKFLRTIDSIGKVESSFLSSEVIPPTPPFDNDSDSSSSASSVEIIENSRDDETALSRGQTREPSSLQERSTELSSSEIWSSMDTSETSPSQQPSSLVVGRSTSVNVSESTSSELRSSVHSDEILPSSSHNCSKDISESGSPGSSTSVYGNQITSPSKHITHPASKLSPSKLTLGASSPAKRQKAISEFFGGVPSSKHKHPV